MKNRQTTLQAHQKKVGEFYHTNVTKRGQKKKNSFVIMVENVYIHLYLRRKTLFY